MSNTKEEFSFNQVNVSLLDTVKSPKTCERLPAAAASLQ